jgi:hypothetical protein
MFCLFFLLSTSKEFFVRRVIQPEDYSLGNSFDRGHLLFFHCFDHVLQSNSIQKNKSEKFKREAGVCVGSIVPPQFQCRYQRN